MTLQVQRGEKKKNTSALLEKNPTCLLIYLPKVNWHLKKNFWKVLKAKKAACQRAESSPHHCSAGLGVICTRAKLICPWHVQNVTAPGSFWFSGVEKVVCVMTAEFILPSSFYLLFRIICVLIMPPWCFQTGGGAHWNTPAANKLLLSCTQHREILLWIGKTHVKLLLRSPTHFQLQISHFFFSWLSDIDFKNIAMINQSPAMWHSNCWRWPSLSSPIIFHSDTRNSIITMWTEWISWDIMLLGNTLMQT